MIIWIFRALVFLLPTQLAYHFWPKWAFIFGIRVDYLSPTVYLTDVLIVMLLVFSFFFKKSKFNFRKLSRPWMFIVIFLVLGNVLGATSPATAIVKWIKILELVLLSLFVANHKSLNFKNDFLKPLLLSASIFSLIGIVQFFKGGTLGGAFYLLGERSFTIMTPGISLVNLAGTDFLRAYSTFSHPNSLGGYLGLALILCLTEKKSFGKTSKIVSLFLLVFGLVLVFSAGVWISLFLVLLIYVLINTEKTISGKIAKWVLAGAIGLSFFVPLVFAPNTNNKFSESSNIRLDLGRASIEMAKQQPLFGVGANNYIVNLPKFSKNSEVVWFLQPVHNIYLLVLSEGGIVGLTIFTILSWKVLRRSLEKKNKGIFLGICFVLIIGTLDHYLFTLQQNLLFLSLILGYSQRHES